MSEVEPTGTLVDPEAASPQTQVVEGAQTGLVSADGTPESTPPDEWAAKVKSTNAENQSLRAKVKEFTDAAEAQRVAALSEQDKLREERDALLAKETKIEADLAERDVREKVLDAARALGIVDPDAAYRLLDRDTLDPEAISDAVKALAEAKPYLVSQPPPSSGGSANPTSANGRGGNDYSALTAEQLARLPDAEYAEAIRSIGA